MNKKKLIISISVYVVIAVLIAALIVGNYYLIIYKSIITKYLGQEDEKKIDVEASTQDTEYFKSDYAKLSDLQSAQADHAHRMQAEGAVLLKNKNNALPMGQNLKITLLGTRSAADDNAFQYGGAGAGAIDTKGTPNLKEAFEKAGYTINPTMWSFYNTGAGKNYRFSYDYTGYTVGEAPQSVFSTTETSSFASYKDAAIIVIGRPGQESSDLPLTTKEDSSKHALELSKNETDLISMAKSNGFSKTIVLLNTMTAMELDQLDVLDVDACLWIGAGGQKGVEAIPEILNGKRYPSGRLVDTYAYDALSAPAMQNFGNFSYDYTSTGASAVAKGTKYVNYAEGIYIGYRYYETRYADKVLGTSGAGNFNYSEEVQYPFGYGQTYTTFEYTSFSMSEKGDTFEFSVGIKNSGARAGKEVIQLYMQSPYTEYDKTNGIEKSAIELVGFAKSNELAGGASQTVRVSVDKEVMRTYDANKAKTYIVEDGDYYFATGTDAHDALNNVLAERGKTTADGMTKNGNKALVKKYNQKTFDSNTYSIGENGEKIINRFDNADYKKTYDSAQKYLSRKDWAGTFPTPLGGSERKITPSAQLIEDLKVKFEEDPDAVMPTTNTVSEEYGALTLASLIGVPYESKYWDALLDQLTADELLLLARMGGYGTTVINSIAKPSTNDKDGPAGISSTLVGGAGCFGYAVAVVVASSWNADLAKEMGDFVGEDGIYSKTSGWYAPSMNIHRTPFSGRNFEYYSEDGFISGAFGAAIVEGVQARGMYAYIKHFALNDQEANRDGVSTFSNEQAIREIYLLPFEKSIREGGARAIMVCMNRIGAKWAGAHKGLMTDVLRNEWGFIGMSITDQASFANEMLDIKQGLAAGTDLWLNTNSTLWTIDNPAESKTIMAALRRSAHGILYAVANSNAMNGISTTTKIVPKMPTWQIWMIIADVALGLIMAAGVVLITIWLIKKPKNIAAKS